MKVSNPILAGLFIVLLLGIRASAAYANAAPTLNQPPDVSFSLTVNQNTTADQAIRGSDPDGDALLFTKTAGPTFMTVATLNATTANIHYTLRCADAGTTTATVTATDTGGLSDSKSFTITVTCITNHPPTANPGGPYQPACPGVNVCFDGSSSSDPDPGQTLTYSWNFDDGTPPATGQNVCHVFEKCGSYNVCLTVTDNGSPPLSNTACTTQKIEIPSPQLTVSRKSPAVVNLKVGNAKDQEVITVTFAGPCLLPGDDIASWKMTFGTSEIVPDSQSSSGAPFTLMFYNDTLKTLFSSLASGKTTNVTVTIEGMTTKSLCKVAGDLTFDVQK